MLILVPLLADEAGDAGRHACRNALALANDRLAPWLREHLRHPPAASIRRRCGSWSATTGAACRASRNKLFESLKIGGVALIGLLVNLMLAPVVMFYLLIDWHSLLARLDNAIPRAWHDKAARHGARRRRRALAVPARPGAGDAGAGGLLQRRAVRSPACPRR